IGSPAPNSPWRRAQAGPLEGAAAGLTGLIGGGGMFFEEEEDVFLPESQEGSGQGIVAVAVPQGTAPGGAAASAAGNSHMTSFLERVLKKKLDSEGLAAAPDATMPEGVTGPPRSGPPSAPPSAPPGVPPEAPGAPVHRPPVPMMRPPPPPSAPPPGPPGGNAGEQPVAKESLAKQPPPVAGLPSPPPKHSATFTPPGPRVPGGPLVSGPFVP
ncbi:unnamed protein product, partial [Polarella glacialis]